MDCPKNILYVCPETAGDVLISTGVIDGIKSKFPETEIWFATKPQYQDILIGNKNITGVIDFDESMYNYRIWETWGPQTNLFDIVFCPSIITQKIPHWIHGGFGEWLGRCYADMCHVKFGKQTIAIDDYLNEEMVKWYQDAECYGDSDLCDYITIQSTTRTDPKDYDHMQAVIDRINKERIKVVHIGGAEDTELNGIDIDLRGKTSPQQLASVIKGAKLHLGLDSFPMHVAGTVGTPAIVLFGGTYAKQGLNPEFADFITLIETEDRGLCPTSCHLLECEMKKRGMDKCINNISVETVVDALINVLGTDCMIEAESITLGAYIIIKDGIKYGFPFEECIHALDNIVDEIVIVDGGSTDGTLDRLHEIKKYLEPKVTNLTDIKILEHEWDMDNPTLFGDEKTYARQQCTSDYLIQIDADEILIEPKHGMIKDRIRQNPHFDVLDTPVINFYGDHETIRVEETFWKWRISKNDANIIHGVHGPARVFDSETGRITMDKKISDSCEYIFADSLEITPHKAIYPVDILVKHNAVLAGEIDDKEYTDALKEIINDNPVVFHYSWMNLERKEENGSFWDETFHGRNETTHNTTKNIKDRVEKQEDKLVKFDIEHPLKKVAQDNGRKN